MVCEILLVICLGALGATHGYYQRIIHRLTIDPVYGVGTRQKIERLWPRLAQPDNDLALIFFDLDNLHELNAKLGYAEVDSRIRSALTEFRQGSYRWYSGDEIIVFARRGEVQAAATRLLGVLQRHGLSATLAITDVSGELNDCVKVAADRVQASKALGKRGVIV